MGQTSRLIHVSISFIIANDDDETIRETLDTTLSHLYPSLSQVSIHTEPLT